MRALDVTAHIVGDLEGPLANAHDAFDIINRAAMAMEAVKPWRYLVRTTRSLAFRAPVTGSAATFTGSTSTLSKTGAFASYTLVPGDYVSLTLNGTEYGNFRVLTRVSDDAITVENDTVTATFTGTATFDLDVSRVALPSDVGRILTVYGERSYNNTAIPSNIFQLSYLDTQTLSTANFVTGYTIQWERTTEKSIPTQILRVWPEPQSAQVAALHANYLRKWPAVTSDQDVLPLPEYMDALFLEYAKAFARSYDESMDLGPQLDAIRLSGVFTSADIMDSGSSNLLGHPMHCAVAASPPSAEFDPFGHPAAWITVSPD